MPGDELKRIREYEKQGNLHLEAAQRALKQFQVSNAPLLKYLDAVDLWDKAGKCFTIAGEYEDASDAFSKGADCLVRIILAIQSRMEIYFLLAVLTSMYALFNLYRRPSTRLSCFFCEIVMPNAKHNITTNI